MYCHKQIQFFKKKTLTYNFLVRCYTLFQMSYRGVHCWCLIVKAYICITDISECIQHNELCKSFPSCTECLGQLGARQLSTLSVGQFDWCVWVEGNKVTAMVPGWAISSEAHAGHLYWIPRYRPEVKLRERWKPQDCFYFFGLPLLLFYNSRCPSRAEPFVHVIVYLIRNSIHRD